MGQGDQGSPRPAITPDLERIIAEQVRVGVAASMEEIKRTEAAQKDAEAAKPKNVRPKLPWNLVQDTLNNDAEWPESAVYRIVKILPTERIRIAPVLVLTHDTQAQILADGRHIPGRDAVSLDFTDPLNRVGTDLDRYIVQCANLLEVWQIAITEDCQRAIREGRIKTANMPDIRAGSVSLCAAIEQLRKRRDFFDAPLKKDEKPHPFGVAKAVTNEDFAHPTGNFWSARLARVWLRAIYKREQEIREAAEKSEITYDGADEATRILGARALAGVGA